jgi:hypothetical protein
MNQRHQPRPQLHFIVAGRRTAARNAQGETTTTSLAPGCDDDHFLRVLFEVFSVPTTVEFH